MGWDIERFPEGEVNLELICCICTCILEDPVESPCRHVFCSTCIKTWLSNQKSCPHCRAPVHKKDLQPVVPLLKNIISKQKIYCDNKEGGCPEIISLEALSSHVAVCQFAMVSCLNDGCIIKVCRKDLTSHMELCSKRTILCEHGCEMFLTLGDRTTHNCVHALRCHFQEVANEMQDRISKLEELVNVLVSKNHASSNEGVSSVDNNEPSDAAVYVPYSIPSPRAYDNASQSYTVFPRLSNTASLSNIATENNDFSDSVESVESENIDQDNEMEGHEFHSRTRQQNLTQEREVSPVYRQLNAGQTAVRASESFESRARNERVSDRVAIRSRSGHNRPRFEPYTRSSRQSNSRSRETRVERTNRTYQYYQRESRRVNPSAGGGGGSGGGGAAAASAAGGGSGNVGGELEEPLILRIGVSSQTVTDSSTSSASSSDSENEE